ncbi:hypothetical protein Ptr902_11068 [Pyrenophora tritici-repentis]|nr:hypothetical protein Ptr902_11068 [Pyrenophora tritici-repentis]
MAVSKDATSAIVTKKVKGLKDHKKAQKEKNAAKRLAAAEKAKAKKLEAATEKAIAAEIIAVTVVAEAEEIATVAQVEPVDSLETTDGSDTYNQKTDVIEVSEDQTNDIQAIVKNYLVVATEVTVAYAADVSPKADSIQRPNSSLNPAVIDFVISNPTIVITSNPPVSPEAAIDIIAHRKALEADMETPREMFMRCKYITSVDAEYLSSFEGDDDIIDESSNKIKCLDSNGFEIIPLLNGLSLADITTNTESAPTLSVDDLFAKVSATNVSKISATESSEILAIDSLDPWACISQILHSSSVSQDGRTLASVEAEMRSRSSSMTAVCQGSRSLEDVEAEMHSGSSSTTASYNSAQSLGDPKSEMPNALSKKVSPPAPFIDPAIVSCKIKSQSLDMTTAPVDNNNARNTTNSPPDLATSSTASNASSHWTRTPSPTHFNSKTYAFTVLTPRSGSSTPYAQCGASGVETPGVIDCARVSKDNTTELMLQEHLKMPPGAYFGNWEVFARGLGLWGWFRTAWY